MNQSTLERTSLSVWAVARRPRWIAALVLALLVAASFAALAQWQFERSVVQATVNERESETPVPLESVAEPQSPVTSDATGQLVTVQAERVPGDITFVSGRVNEGAEGYWVVGHYVASDGASIAVALGWARTQAQADAAADALSAGAASTTIVGRYLPGEPPQESDFESGERNTVSVAALINEWNTEPNGVYGGYIVAADAPAGLDPIYSPAPDDEVQINWLSFFYAIEWLVFAAFGVYLWYRLVKDAWEREMYEADEKEQESAQLN